MRKRTVKKLQAAVRRIEKRKAKELAAWAKREQRLLQLIDAVKSNPTMQDTSWVEGQTRHFEKLLANHRAARPKG